MYEQSTFRHEVFAIVDEQEESSEKKEYQNAARSEQVSDTDNLHL